MDDIEANPSEVNSCFRVTESFKINIVDLSKKRKLQAEPFEFPSPKHNKCWDRSFTTGPISTFGSEALEVVDAVNKDKKQAMAQGDGSDLESAEDSNTMADDSNSATSAYGGGKVEPEHHAMVCSYDRPSTSSASWGGSGNSFFTYSSDSYGALNKGSTKVSEIQECQNVEELGFGDIEQCTDEELEAILNSNGLNLNKYVLSSGRWSVGQESQQSARKPTIDQEFEQYFSMLML